MGYRWLLVAGLLLPSLLWAENTDAPSLGLLEFLAEGAVVDGAWTDPVEVQQMSAVKSENTAHTKTSGDKPSSADEVKEHE